MEHEIKVDIEEVYEQSNYKVCSVIIPIKKAPHGEIRIFNWLDNPICRRIEVIIVQDCIQPSEGREIRELVATLGSQEVVYIEGNFGNPGSARNAGLLSATCEWFAFWDADDLPDLEKFLIALEKARNNDSQILIASFNVRHDMDPSKLTTYEISSRTDLLVELSIRPGLWRFAFKSDEFRALKLIPSSMGEDQAYISALSIFNWRICISKLPTYDYFLGESGHLTNNVMLMRDMRISIRQIENGLKTQRGKSRKLSYLYIVKQALTCLKRGQFNLKVWAAYKLLSLILIHPTIVVQYIFILSKSDQ